MYILIYTILKEPKLPFGLVYTKITTIYFFFGSPAASDAQSGCTV